MNNHDHKYFLFETRATFERFVIDKETTLFADERPEDLYQRVEYAILYCNCGEVIKRKVKGD